MSTKERKPRNDAGKHRFTERDLMCFEWLASMKAMYEEDLGVLIARELGVDKPSSSAIKSMTSRWSKAGMAEAEKILYKRPRIVRLMPKGAALLGESGFRATSEMMSYHTAEISRIRLYIEKRGSSRFGAVKEWFSERHIRQTDQDRASTQHFVHQGGHTPDGIVLWEDGSTSAVEVELSLKNSDRLNKIVKDLAESRLYDQMIYVTDNENITNAVREAWKAADMERRKAGREKELSHLAILDIQNVLEV